jgi:hypothetical protein
VDGGKDVLGLWAGTGGEGAKFWMSVLVDLKNRGVRDVFFLVCDGLTDQRLPAHRPSGATDPGRVEAAGHKVQALQGGLLGREAFTITFGDRWPDAETY